MIIIKKITNILFFILLFTLIIFLIDKLGVIKFLVGLFKVLMPILAGLFISVVMEGVISKFINKGYKRKKVVIISYIVLVISLIAGVSLLFPSLVKQVTVFIETLPSLVSNIENLLSKYHLDISSIVDITKIKFDKLVNYISGSITIIFNIGIAISSAFFISYDYDLIEEKIKKTIPDIIKNEVIYFFRRYLPFFSKYIYSLLIDSLITFAISFVLFLIFGIDYSLIGALIITITNLIPYIGPIIGVIPLFIIGYSVSSYFAIMSLVIVLIVQIIESNIIQPLIFKNVIKIHPLEGIVGVLIFSYLFSVVGMILSPLLVVAFKLLFIEKYKEESQFETSSIQ